MKKLTTALMLSAALSLQAGVNFGLTQTTLDEGDPGYGFDMSTEWMFAKPKQAPGVEFGLGTDLAYFSLGKVKGLSDDAGMQVNLDLLAGYSFAHLGTPVTLLAGVGYGMGMIGSDAYDGINYQGAIEYDFSDTKGIGLKYNHNDADLTLAGTSSDINSYVLYIKLFRKK